MQSLLQLSERWPSHIWLVGRIKFVSLEASFSLNRGLLVNPILLSGWSPDMTEILLTWKLYHISINQSIQINITTI